MASPIIWSAGLAGTGVDTATVSPDYFGTNVIWVNSANSAASDANAGTEPELPLATLAQAITNASAGACIAVSATHTQTISVTLTVNKAGLRFVGFGTGTARPTLTPSSGAIAVFTVSAANVVIDNFYLKAAAATSGAASRVVSTASGTQVLNCQVDCGAFDQEGVLLNASADNARIEGCTFTATASRPTRAIGLGAAVSNFQLMSTIIDGATFGWAGNAVTVNSAINMVAKNVTLQGNSDLNGTTVASYQMYGIVAVGASRVTIT